MYNSTVIGLLFGALLASSLTSQPVFGNERNNESDEHRGRGRRDMTISMVITTSREQCRVLGGTPINNNGTSSTVRCKLSDNLG